MYHDNGPKESAIAWSVCRYGKPRPNDPQVIEIPVRKPCELAGLQTWPQFSWTPWYCQTRFVELDANVYSDVFVGFDQEWCGNS